MRNTKWKQIWDVLYPVVLYLIVSDCIYMLVVLAIGTNTVSPMMLQIVTALLSSPLVLYLYASDRNGMQIKKNRKDVRKNLFRLLLACIASIGLAVSLNNLIGMTGLQERSVTYQKVNASFFSSTLLVEFFGTSFVTPVLEEILYRGIVYERLKRYGKTETAIFLSGLIFGAMHFNLVQFVYAGLIGMFLAAIYETEGTLLAPILAHAAANAVSVLRVETGFLSGFSKENQFFFPMSLFLFVISIIIAKNLTKGRLFEKRFRHN